MKKNNFNYRLLQNFSCLACLSFVAFAANANAEVKKSNDSLLNSPSQVAVQTGTSFANQDSAIAKSTSEVVHPSSRVDLRRDLQKTTVAALTAEASQLLRHVQPTESSLQVAGQPDKNLSKQDAAIVQATPEVVNPSSPVNLSRDLTLPVVTSLENSEIISADFANKLGNEELDAIEAKTDKLAQVEASQFSTTTKLLGNVFFNITGASGADNLQVETGRRVGGVPEVAVAPKPNITLSNLVWLTLKTSFTGKDSLTTQLAMGNGESPYNSYNGYRNNFNFSAFNSTGVPFTDQTAGPNVNQVVLRELSYEMPVLEKATLVVGARVNFYKYFDDNRFTFPLNGTTSFNSINSTLLTNAKRGAGAVFVTPVGDKFDFRVGYLVEENEFLPGPRSASNPAQGFFGGNNALTAEIGFKPNDNSKIRLLYSRTNLQADGFGRVGGIGATPSLPGLADDGLGGALSNGQSDVFSANFDWLLTQKFGLFGRYGISSTNLNRVAGGSAGSVTTQAFQVGMAFPDLFKEGSLGTLSLVMPFNFTGGRNLVVSGAGNGGVQYDIEAAVSVPLGNNISVVPAAYLILNPNNFSGNPSIFVGNLRMQYSF